jgi:DNA-binding NarL/FixJ family response regulator
VTRARAFLVEDSPIVVDTLSATLEEMADVAIVGSASTEEEALFWFGSRTDACDVAIIDIVLPSGSGLGVLKGMKGFAPPPQRVVLTNYSTPTCTPVARRWAPRKCSTNPLSWKS